MKPNRTQIILLLLLLLALAIVIGYYNRRIAAYDRQLEKISHPN